MEEKDALHNFMKESNIDQVRDLEEMRDYFVTMEKYLESRVMAKRQLETEIYLEFMKLTEEKLKLKHRLTAKMKEACEVVPHRDTVLRRYILNRVFCFDMTPSGFAEIEEFAPPSHLEEKMKGLLPVKLILRDSRHKTLCYLLVYSPKTLTLVSVQALSEDASEAVVCQKKEVASLVDKLKAFVGEDYHGTKQLVIDDLVTFGSFEEPEDSMQTDNSAFE